VHRLSGSDTAIDTLTGAATAHADQAGSATAMWQQGDRQSSGADNVMQLSLARSLMWKRGESEKFIIVVMLW